MDGYEVIIFGIIWLLLSLLGRKKPQAHPGKPQKRSIFEELIEEATGKAPQQPLPPEYTEEYPEPVSQEAYFPEVEETYVPQYQPEAVSSETNTSQEVIYEEVPADYFERKNYSEVTRSSLAPVTEPLEVIDDLSEGGTKPEHFDLREAVIYSEILTPKYGDY